MRKCIASAAIALFLGGVCRSTPAQDKASELALQIVQTKPGNVFLQGDAITFGIETGGESLKWIVQDFWRAQVMKGSSPVEGGKAQIVLPLKKLGYFILRVMAERGGRSTSRETPFALLTPFDLTKAPDSPFGIMTHFCQAYTLKIIPLIALTGVKTTRDEHFWFLTEQEKDKYIFFGHKWHDELSRLGIRPFVVLGYDNRFYDTVDGKLVSPYTDAGIEGYARYGAAVAAHYADQSEAVEVFNEYTAFCTGPAASKPENYFKMLKATYEAVKAARPETVVVGCATSGLPWMWIEQVFALGGLNYMDVVSVHPYRSTDLSPETLEPDMAKLTELIARYNTTGKPRPIWCTEISWASGGEYVSEETQADYLVRTYIVLIASGVEKIYWYEMGGHSYQPPDAPFREDSPGYAVLRHLKNPIGSLTPKPSFVSLAVMTRQLTGAAFVSRDKTREWIRCYVFEKDGEPIHVVWAMQSGTVVAVRVEAPVTVVDLMGEAVTLTPVDGVVYLTLSGSPLYLKGRIGAYYRVRNSFRPVTGPNVR